MPPAPGRARWPPLLRLSAFQDPWVPQPLLALEHLHGHGGWAATGPDFCGPTRLARPSPPHRSGVRLAQSPESVGSFIEMLPQLCPSSRFQSPKHPPQPLPVPSLTLETGLSFWEPREDSRLIPWWGGPDRLTLRKGPDCWSDCGGVSL